MYISGVYLGCVCLGQAEEEAVEAWNRTKGIDKVTILESERDGAPEMDRVRRQK